MHKCSQRSGHFPFQSTRPRGARLCRLRRAGLPLRFNPRARGGRDRLGFHPQRNGSVSIHAPAGGATRNAVRIDSRHFVSIHAPAGGATVSTTPCGCNRTVSIHAPAGGATRAGMTYGPITGVSIHAPAGGATHAGRITFQAQRVSIHAPAGGATCPVATWRSSLHRFQSTRPRGARRHNQVSWPVAFAFQSTRPRGARLPASGPHTMRIMFQSTRPRGARLLKNLLRQRAAAVSIHAPAGGATVWSGIATSRWASFNPRARGGRDRTTTTTAPA